MKLQSLYTIIQERKNKKPKDSYVAELFRAGDDRIIQKIGEEAAEVIIAAKNQKRKAIIEEMADLWFSILILMVRQNITIKDIEVELERRRRT